MTIFQEIAPSLKFNKFVWLVTGVAGFIGSNLLEALLKLDQHVIGLDNFSTGFKKNLDEVKEEVTAEQWSNFDFFEGDICDFGTCLQVCKNVDYVLHHAALGSVPRSIQDPILTNNNNIDGFLNMLVAARDSEVKRFIYAASSSTYGDHPGLPKTEDKIGRPLSPYAVTKFVNELYADVFHKVYGLESVGLRYFNVFGRRQSFDGAYAAVIPKWIFSMITGRQVLINGDGETSRDFCYIDNVVQANLLSAVAGKLSEGGQVYNVAVGERTSLNQLYGLLKDGLRKNFPHLDNTHPVYCDYRVGDVRHSLADISRAQLLLGYKPRFKVKEGLEESLSWYIKNVV